MTNKDMIKAKKKLTARQARLLEETKEAEKKLGKQLLTGETDQTATSNAIDILHAAIEDMESGDEYRIKGATDLLKAMKNGDFEAFTRLTEEYKEANE